jgi:hypothetical protein
MFGNMVVEEPGGRWELIEEVEDERFWNASRSMDHRTMREIAKEERAAARAGTGPEFLG